MMNTEYDTDRYAERLPAGNADYRDESAKTAKRRIPVIAALMSAGLPGFGQLYNGKLNRGIWLFLVFCLVSVPLVAAIALFLPPKLTVVILFFGVLLPLGIWIWGIIDAWRGARASVGYRLKAWQTSGLYTLVFLLCLGVVLPLVVSYVRNHQVQAFRVPSRSMMPTVQYGDFIFANMNYNCPNCWWSVKRGDVAVFVFPNNRNLHYLKRIIGLPGDEVVVSAGVVSVNGAVLGNPDTTDRDLPVTEEIEGRVWSVIPGNNREDFSVQVEPGHVFVLGDNRSSSNDSRVFGQVPMADVVGRVRQVWFSMNKEGIQWERIGHSLIPVSNTR